MQRRGFPVKREVQDRKRGHKLKFVASKIYFFIMTQWAWASAFTDSKIEHPQPYQLSYSWKFQVIGESLVNITVRYSFYCIGEPEFYLGFFVCWGVVPKKFWGHAAARKFFLGLQGGPRGMLSQKILSGLAEIAFLDISNLH